MEPSQKVSQVAAWILTGVVGALVVLVFQLNRRHDALTANCERSFASHEARIGVLETRIAAGKSTDPPPVDPLSGTRSLDGGDPAGAHLSALLARIESLEARIDHLAELNDGSETPPIVDPHEMVTSRVEAFEELVRSRPSMDVVAEHHARESGQSEWGVATTERLSWAYADAPFFAEHGGRLSLDCRQSSCRIEWRAPDLSGLDAFEAEQQLSLADYELLAVVAKGGSDIGPIHTVSTSEGGDSRISLYFTRQPSE